jgi:type VI secretion system protein ImpL
VGSGSARIDELLPLYGLLVELAESESVDSSRARWGSDFGLFQGPRLARSADQSYRRVLDRTLAPQLVERLNAALRQERDPAARYEALRIGLMLGEPARMQRGEVRRWAAQAFAAPGSRIAPGAGEQQDWLRHLDALLERNALQQVLVIDPASVAAARQALLAWPIEQRVHERLLRRAREAFPGDRGLVDLAGPGATLAFAAHDVPTLPSIHLRQAWTEAIEPAIEPTLAALATEAEWVLGDRSAATQRLARERAAREPIVRQVAQRHARGTEAAWELLLDHVTLAGPVEGDVLGGLAAQLAAPESALRQLLRRLASEFPAPVAGASAASTVYDTALAEAFGPLRDYTLGSGANAPDRLLAPLAGAAADPARLATIGRDLRTEAAAAPSPLREIWAELANAAAAQARRAQERQLGNSMAELAQACRRLTAERFPFASDAKSDMPFADFARLFGPQGLFDQFVRTRLNGIVDTQRRPWKLVGEASGGEKAQAALRAFETAEDIRRVFFAGPATLPQLRMQFTPAAMDAELLLFSADVDGQLLRYENGPRRTKALTWPGPAATQKVVLRILPPGPSGVGAEVWEGPWALLRVLQRRAGDTASSARLTVDGRTLAVDIATDAPGGLRVLAELPRFRCPEPW